MVRTYRFQNLVKTKVLITGGLGFIGSTLARRLVDLKAKVTLVDSLIPEYGGNLFNLAGIRHRLKVNIADIRDQHGMEYLVQNQDIIFNLAGTLSHIDSMTDPFTDLDVNVRSQLSLLEACRHHNPQVKIIYAGTRNQYGKAQYLPVDEKHPLEPTDINGINCNAAEWYHLLYHRVYSLKTASLRLTNTFGPRHQMKHSRQGVLNWFVRQIIDHQPIQIFGTGKQIRDVNYVDDVVEAFLLVAASNSPKVWGQAFNLGGTPTSLTNFVKTAIRIAGQGSFIIAPYPGKLLKDIEIGNYIANWKKIQRTVSWRPRTSLATGISQTLAFYRRYKRHYWE